MGAMVNDGTDTPTQHFTLYYEVSIYFEGCYMFLWGNTCDVYSGVFDVTTRQRDVFGESSFSASGVYLNVWLLTFVLTSVKLCFLF